MTRVAILDDYAGLARTLPCWDRLRGRVSVESFGGTLADETALAARLAPYPVVVGIRERTRFTASLLARLPALRLLALAGRHSGQVDVADASARGVLVTDIDGTAPPAVEHTIGLILALVRRIPQDDRALRAGRWQTALGTELARKTLGIVGLGKIGTRIAAFGALVGMRVVATGLTLTAERAAAAGARLTDLDGLMRESDVVSVHLRLSDRTRGLITARHLALMKPTAFLVNTARGPIVDETALVETLRAGRIAGAALDVFGTEPLPPAHPLLALDNVVLTPHTGFVTRETFEVFFEQTVASIAEWLDGKTPARAVNATASS